ncbi:5'-3' exoribonuclease 1 [Pancytospora epiphaga]|nr:5'-3' exoribonuclease 1 [Pancytospora epiphaga]
MGVPSLYKWLTQRYPAIKKPISEKSRQDVDCLYLDFNAIVHPCCNKGFGNMEDTETQLYSNIINYVNKLMSIVHPKKLLYIAIDGVAPRAKLNQQRARRFVKAKESMKTGQVYFKDESSKSTPRAEAGGSTADKAECDEKLDEEVPRQECFDTNAITPGTRFMDRLDLFLQELIQAKLSEDLLWQNINVIFSGYRTPGEGEQKIMEYIRKHQTPGLKHMIYSPDADLIFLGLTLFDYSVFIMREEPKVIYGNGDNKDDSIIIPEIVENSYDDKDFVCVDIAKLRRSLINDFRSVIKTDFSYKNFLTDWIFLCFALGNDFLPSAPCFEIRSNAIDKITVVLLELFKKTGKHITNKKEINFDVLKEFFSLCSAREDDFLVEKSRNLYLSRTRMNIPFDPKEEFPLNSEKGKIRFYIEKMDIKSEKELLEACKEYIKGFVWIYNYYFFEINSWGWYYPFHFAPFMMDLARVSNISFSFSLNKPLRPMEQLLAVMPPHSKGLLPEPLWEIFEENKEMYPTEFKIDRFQKCMEWQAVPILPFADIMKLRKAFQARQSALTYEETNRNIISYPLFFSRQDQAVQKTEELYDFVDKPFEYFYCDELSGRIFPVLRVYKIGEDIDNLGFKYTNRATVFSFDQRVPRVHIKK